MEQPQDEPNPLQAYFEWQVTTLMLARDLHDPIPPGDEDAAMRRRQQLEDEVRQMTIEVVPDKYKADPSLSWPAELMRQITRVTLRRAAEIAGKAEA